MKERPDKKTEPRQPQPELNIQPVVPEKKKEIPEGIIVNDILDEWKDWPPDGGEDDLPTDRPATYH